MKKIQLIIAASLTACITFAQTQFIRKDSIPVFINSQQVLFPWAGGMNFCQYSNIDLNQDGIEDIFVFDRSGNKILTFVNNGTPNQADYRYAPEYIPQFPTLHDWAILRDYNCDGKMDIFTNNQSTIRVFKNVSTVSGGLQFQLVSPELMLDREPNSTHLMVPLNVSWIDIPAIRDVDGDGDLDVLNFGVGGQQVEYIRNMSKENYGICDSLVFTLESLCWGDFSESQMDATLTLHSGCNPPPVAPDASSYNAERELHGGSCLECINTDGDNDQDLLVGDLSNYYINLLRNGGDSSYASGDTIDDHYPGYDTPAQLNLFGCGFHLDVNNDGVKDVIFAPNNNAISENFVSSWYYKNTGRNDSVRLQFVTNSFLQGDMIDVGEGALPVFFDYDHDGDKDLFVGDKAYFDVVNLPPARLALFKNIGNATNPAYVMITRNLLGLDTVNGLGLRGVAPTFGDLDGDGDEDLLIGDVNGHLHYFRKDPGSDTNFVYVSSNYLSFSIGQFIVPQLVDVDRDGLLDLLVGEQTGNVNYIHNSGTSTNPVFTSITNPLFGGFFVTQSGFTTGYSTPFLYDVNGSYVLFVGSERGFLFRFDNIDGNLNGSFTLTDSLYVSHYEGGRIAPAVTDLNNDGLFDVAIGNYSGGVAIFYGDNGVGTNDLPAAASVFTVYPNPAASQITIESENGKAQSLVITDLSGKRVYESKLSTTKTVVDVSGFAAGMYICTVTGDNGFIYNQKLLIGR
jgi:hypothetical protein